MEASIETRAPPDRIWKAWEQAHAVHDGGPLAPGQRAKSNGFKYRIADVVPGRSFAILWKSLFVRMVFTHTVRPLGKGSAISYCAEIQGLFAWPVRFLLKKKIEKNLAFVLKEFVKQLN